MLERLIRAFVAGFLALVRGFSRGLYKLKIRGAEHVPATGPCIFIIHHSSKLDITLGAFLYQARPDIGGYGSGLRLWASPFAKALGATPMFKGVGHSGPFLWTALNALQKGRPIAIAPEGEMEWDGRVLPLKPGAAWLALRSGAPIIVTVLRGGYAIWPRWARFPRLTGKLEIRIGEPFRFPAVTRGRVDEEMLQAVNRRIADEIRRLVEEP